MICQTCGQQVDPHGACLRCGTPAGQPPVWPTVPTRTVTGVGTAASVLVAAAAAAEVVLSVIVPLVNRGLARRAMETLDVEPLNAAGLLTFIAAALEVALFIAAGVVFIVWMWRAHKNLYAFPGVTPRMTAGWSIGGWFIPLANLVIPARTMNDIAKGSLPWVPMRTGVYPMVAFWWTALLISACASGVATSLDDREIDQLPTVLAGPGDFQRYVNYYGSTVGRNLIGTVAFSAAAVLAIILIRRISRAQTMRIARAYQLGGLPTYAAGPPPAPAVPAAPSPDAAAPSPDPAASPPSPEAPAAEPGTPT